MDTNIPFSDSEILAAQKQGMDIRSRPEMLLPDIQRPPVSPSIRESLANALLGVKAGMDASSGVNHLGDPLLSAIASASGAISAPTFADISAARDAAISSARVQQMEGLPVEKVAPKLVEAYPELRGVPLGIVSKLTPILESHARQNRDSLPITEEMIKNYPGVSKLGYQVGQSIPITVLNQATKESGLVLSEKEQQYVQKRLTALGDALDPSKQRSGAFGVSKQVYDRAERLQSLASAYSDGNLDSRQMEELAIGLNSMLSGSNTGAQSQVAALVPKTIVGNAQKLREWLTNDPQGMNQQAFVQRMLGSIDREKATAEQQIKRTQMQRIARYSDLEKSSPDEFINVIQAAGIDPSEYKKWKDGGFKAMSAVQSAENSVKVINTQSEYDALPKGSRYQDSQGRMGIKQ